MPEVLKNLLDTKVNITFRTLLLLPLILVVVKVIWELVIDIFCLIWAILAVITRRILFPERPSPKEKFEKSYRKKLSMGRKYTGPYGIVPENITVQDFDDPNNFQMP